MGDREATVLHFPTDRVPRALDGGGSRWLRGKAWAKRTLATWATGIGLPGAIRDTDIQDGNRRVSVRVGASLVRVTVDDRDYYFDRLSGRFDGTGSAP